MSDVGLTPPELVLPKNVQTLIWELQKQCLDVGFTPPEIVLSETVQDWCEPYIQTLFLEHPILNIFSRTSSGGVPTPDTVSGAPNPEQFQIRLSREV